MTLCNRACQLIKRSPSGEEDDYGNEIPEDAPRATSVCEVQQKDSDEQPTGSPASSEWDGFFPDGVDLSSVDAVNVPGLGMFEIVSDPVEWRSPVSGGRVYTFAKLRKTGPGEEIEEGS